MGKKLSPAMQNVVDMMRDGWQLGKNGTFDGRWWLQKGGVGRGDKIEKVTAGTAYALYSRKVIEVDKRSFPTTTYKLVEE